jgi:hypothetical protein
LKKTNKCFSIDQVRGRKVSICGIFLAFWLGCLSIGHASAGTEAASFLDIPVGGRPAALGSSYSALASDAYAPVWNPAGLGFLDSTQLAGMHLSYLETISYEFASFVHPLSPGHSIGFAGQYFSPGNVAGTSDTGSSIGNFSGHYATYSMAYGQTLCDRLSLGVTGKLIDAKISDVSAHAYAFDAGVMAQATQRLRFAAVIANVGTPLKFLSDGDSLPSAVRVGVAYSPIGSLNLTAEGVHRFSGLTSAHTGAEWLPVKIISLRVGFRSDTVSQLSGLSGLTTGLGLHLWGQEFDYAWVPLGDLGTTQYFSLVLRFGAPDDASKNLQTHRSAKNTGISPEAVFGTAL